jgi:hypothetical protein
VGNEEGQRVGPLAAIVDKMNAQAIDGGAKVCQAVQCLLLGPPVKPRPPVVDELLEIGQMRAIVPRRPRDLIGPAGVGEALAQVRQDLVRNVNGERLHSHDDALLYARRFFS